MTDVLQYVCVRAHTHARGGRPRRRLMFSATASPVSFFTDQRAISWADDRIALSYALPAFAACSVYHVLHVVTCGQLSDVLGILVDNVT
jgi:hypothetical protein